MTFSQFDPENYGAAASRLMEASPTFELGPGQPNAAAHAELKQLDADRLFTGRRVTDDDLVACCISGLWLLHNFLEESHHISQNIDTREGSYWHALMHRREPDFSNAKYWFRRVGRHPIFESLAQEAQATVSQATDPPARALAESNTWDPMQFVDACQAVYLGKSQSAAFCSRLALREWQLLFDYCYCGAIGGEKD